MARVIMLCAEKHMTRDLYMPGQRQNRRNGGDAAAKTLLQIEVASLKSKGKEITPEAEQTLLSTDTWPVWKNKHPPIMRLHGYG